MSEAASPTGGGEGRDGDVAGASGGGGGGRGWWPGVIHAVQTPLGLFALVMLVMNGVALLLVPSLTGNQPFYVILTMLGVTVVVALLAVVQSTRGGAPSGSASGPRASDGSAPRAGGLTGVGLTGAGLMGRASRPAYQVFVSAPMAAWEPGRFKENNAAVLKVVDALVKDAGLRPAFYAGTGVEDASVFDEADFSMDHDLEGVRDSRWFVLVWPEKLASSVLVEIGAAIALGKPCVLFVRKGVELPFLLKEITQSKLVRANVREFESYEQLAEVIRRNHRQIFAEE